MTKLETINAEDLQNRTYEPTPFLVDELIPEGLHILAGAPKIGKSWLALWLCLCVAQGQALWNFATTQGEALYLSLEDSFQRIQTRLFDLTEDAPPTLHFAIMADTLKHGLEQQIEQFLMEHPTTKLVVIDTLQRVRGTGSDSNLYANDYQDIGLLKNLADKQHIAILWNSIYKSSLHARGRKGAYEKGLGDLPRHRYSRRIYAGVCKTSANRGWRCRNCFPGHNNLYGRRLHHKTARDADRQQTVLYHVCISGRTFRNADGQADCLHRRGTGKGSAQRIKFS